MMKSEIAALVSWMWDLFYPQALVIFSYMPPLRMFFIRNWFNCRLEYSKQFYCNALGENRQICIILQLSPCFLIASEQFGGSNI